MCLSICLSIHPSVCLSIRSQLENTSQICLCGFSSYLDTIIIGWQDNGSIKDLEVKGHLEGIWGHCLMHKLLLRLHDFVDFGETRVKRSLARSSFGVFRNFLIRGYLRSFSLTLGLDFHYQNTLIGLALYMNNPDNILNRLNLLWKFGVHPRSNVNLWLDFQYVPIWLKYDRDDHDDIVNRLKLLLGHPRPKVSAKTQ